MLELAEVVAGQLHCKGAVVVTGATEVVVARVVVAGNVVVGAIVV